MDTDILGFLTHPDGRTVTLIACPSESLDDTFISVFPTADDKKIVAAISEELLAMITKLPEAEEALSRLAEVVGLLAEETEPSDLSWMDEAIDE